MPTIATFKAHVKKAIKSQQWAAVKGYPEGRNMVTAAYNRATIGMNALYGEDREKFEKWFRKTLAESVQVVRVGTVLGQSFAIQIPPQRLSLASPVENDVLLWGDQRCEITNDLIGALPAAYRRATTHAWEVWLQAGNVKHFSAKE